MVTVLVHYGFARSVEEPGRYVVVEVYRNAVAHAAHVATAWCAGQCRRRVRLLGAPMEINQYVSPGAEPAVRRMREAQA